MIVKAKFQVSEVAESGYSGKRNEIHKHYKVGDTLPDGSVAEQNTYISTGIPARKITLSAVYGGSAEDQSFAQATPSGTFTFQLDNPNLAEEFKPGDTYDITMTRRED